MYRFVDHTAKLEVEREVETAHGVPVARLVPLGVVKG